VSRIQLALNVDDLERAVRFYSTMFGVGPAKVRPGYANFAVADPPLKLVLIENADAAPGSLNHLGVEVDSSAQVRDAATRLAAGGLATDVEEKSSCCYALQDKVWVEGPAGEPWEFYTVLGDSDAPAAGRGTGAADEHACCAPSSGAGSGAEVARARG